MKLQDVHDNAKLHLKDVCRFCRRCDGHACAGEIPGLGGIGTGAAFTANVRALDDVHLRMSVLHDAVKPDLSTNLFGVPLRLPVVAAPIGGIRYNVSKELDEHEYQAEVVKGCLSCGTLACTGDGGTPDIFEGGLQAIIENGGQGIPVIKPWLDADCNARMERVSAAGCTVIGMDIDSAGITVLAKTGHPVAPRSKESLRDLVKKAHDYGLKFVLKGIMSVKDAVVAADAGCDGIVVSNHGGRAADFVHGTAKVLPAIVTQVSGSTTILADGGIRTGSDVLKMMALGASAVLVGRPIIKGAVGGGGEGVEAVLGKIKRELTTAMILTGCASLDDVDATLIDRSE